VTFADRLGTLLLLAAILRELPGGIAPGVEPIWVVEDPEAHLHPMTLASTHRVLERIRWQKIVTTESGDLLTAVPLAQVRRLIRHEGVVLVAGLAPRALSREHLRRVGYHLRLHRGVAMFARVWLLVEGESEFWILPQVAEVMGYDLALEGICCVGFAQCGIEPLVRAAREFRIEWHLLADGDEAGRRYAEQARAFAGRHEVQAPTSTSATSNTVSGSTGMPLRSRTWQACRRAASGAPARARRSPRPCNGGRSRSSPSGWWSRSPRGDRRECPRRWRDWSRPAWHSRATRRDARLNQAAPCEPPRTQNPEPRTSTSEPFLQGMSGGATRRLLACSKAYARAMRRGSAQALAVKVTPNGAGLALKPSGSGGVGALGTMPNGTATIG
jgi:Protein of unknown function (DUF2813)/Overcoming lysogenization defect protein-like, TOPRIM domain